MGRFSSERVKAYQFLLPLSLLTLSLVSCPSPAKGFITTVGMEEADQVLGLDLSKEKLSHFRVFWHDIVSGARPTSVAVVQAVPANSSTGFGMVRMIDNPLTEGPGMRSKLVGRAQGFYASACQSDIGLLMTMNFAITEGKYNGSTFTVVGRNMVLSKVREMAVVGGSGLFRFARGYVLANTHSYNPSTGDATVQYHCHLIHY